MSSMGEARFSNQCGNVKCVSQFVHPIGRGKSYIHIEHNLQRNSLSWYNGSTESGPKPSEISYQDVCNIYTQYASYAHGTVIDNLAKIDPIFKSTLMQICPVFRPKN